MNEQIIGLVLKQQEYKEKDVLLTVLSKDFGKFTLLARGILKMESKNAAACMPYALASFSLDFDNLKKIQNLKTATILSTHHKIRENLDKMTIASIFCEVADQLSQSDMVDESSTSIFEVLMTCLGLLNEEPEIYLVLSLYIATILNVLGLAPVVDECVTCGDLKVVGISMDEGGFICGQCAREVAMLPQEAFFLKQFRLINKANLAHYPILKEHGPWDKALSFLLVDFLILHSGIKISSYRFLQSL